MHVGKDGVNAASHIVNNLEEMRIMTHRGYYRPALCLEIGLGQNLPPESLGRRKRSVFQRQIVHGA